MTRSPWDIRTVDGRQLRVDYGKSVTLESGVRINFGEMVGEVKI